MSTVRVYQAEELRPIHDRVLVTEMEFGEQKTAGGIIMPGDDGIARGIHPRWGKVIAKGAFGEVRECTLNTNKE